MSLRVVGPQSRQPLLPPSAMSSSNSYSPGSGPSPPLPPHARLGPASPQTSFIPLAHFHAVGWGWGSRGEPRPPADIFGVAFGIASSMAWAVLPPRQACCTSWISHLRGVGVPCRAADCDGDVSGADCLFKKDAGHWTAQGGLAMPCPNPKACKQQGLFSPSPTALPIPISFIFPAKEHSFKTNKHSSPNKADDIFFGSELVSVPLSSPGHQLSTPLSPNPAGCPHILLAEACSLVGRAVSGALALCCTDAAAVLLPQANPLVFFFFPLSSSSLNASDLLPGGCPPKVRASPIGPATSYFSCRA